MEELRDAADPRRLPGSGGACEIALLARRVFVIARQSPRLFVDRVDFVTSTGFVGGRRPEGAKGAGPVLVITDLATYGFDTTVGEMRIRTLHPGVTYEEVRAATGWPIPPPDTVAWTPGPTCEELAVLRALDPHGHYLGNKA